LRVGIKTASQHGHQTYIEADVSLAAEPVPFRLTDALPDELTDARFARCFAVPGKETLQVVEYAALEAFHGDLFEGFQLGFTDDEH
jgi:hypothetical protein